jgi:hypothetical protein
MTGQGHQTFVDELARFAAGRADARLTAIAERAAAPLLLAVHGRPMVGRGTVARALGRAGAARGIRVTGQAPPDVVVYVTAEVAKPEDIEAVAAIAAEERPVVAVLTKADLTGSLSGRPDGAPVAAARVRCAELSALLGVPVEPMIGLLALAALDGLDDAVWAALRALADDPRGAAVVDASYAGFLAADNPVPADVRARVLASLDLFGTALVVAALRRGHPPARVRALLRRISGVDAVLDRVCLAGAEARYRRVLRAVAELEALAVAGGEVAEDIGAFLASDDAVVARMAAAVDAAEAAGLDVAPPADAGDYLKRAVHWKGYSRGPASDLHRACGADIARGSLRLWSRTAAPWPGGHR